MKTQLINSDFYNLDGNLSDKLDYYLDHLELLRLIYLNQYITFITKRSHSTRMKGSLGLCERDILNKISKINYLIKRSTENELKNALAKIKIFEKIVEKIQEDIPTFNNKLLKTDEGNNDNGNNLTRPSEIEYLAAKKIVDLIPWIDMVKFANLYYLQYFLIAEIK